MKCGNRPVTLVPPRLAKEGKQYFPLCPRRRLKISVPLLNEGWRAEPAGVVGAEAVARAITIAFPALLIRSFRSIISFPHDRSERDHIMTTAELTRYEIDVEDVEYLRHGEKPLLARVYMPRGTGPFPLIIDLHGGAWIKKDRLSDVATCEGLAKAGIVAVALDF